MKLVSWNVNGLRSIQKKGFQDFIDSYKPDLLCLQETKIGINQLEGIPTDVEKYGSAFSGANKNGYSGVATYYSRKGTPDVKKNKHGIGEKIFDSEGRFVITEHDDFRLYNIYFPSGTSGEIRQDYKYKFLDRFLKHVKALPKKTRDKLIICGDFNICHREIDIHHPDKATKQELSGFLPDERSWMDRFVEAGFVDTFRHSNGDVKDRYSWWSYRAGARGKNLGWRIDYFFVSDALKNRIKKADILHDVTGSDHCPVTLEIK